MGEQVGRQERLFYEFCLDDMVPGDHLPRRIDSVVDLSRLRRELSPTDPAAAWTTRGRHKVMFGYSLNYLIDMEQAIIVDVEATPTRISKEVDASETMVERTEERFGLKPKHLGVGSSGMCMRRRATGPEP